MNTFFFDVLFLWLFSIFVFSVFIFVISFLLAIFHVIQYFVGFSCCCCCVVFFFLYVCYLFIFIQAFISLSSSFRLHQVWWWFSFMSRSLLVDVNCVALIPFHVFYFRCDMAQNKNQIKYKRPKRNKKLKSLVFAFG